MAHPQQTHTALSPSSTANSLSQQLTQHTLLLSITKPSDGFVSAHLFQSNRSLIITLTRSAKTKSCLPSPRKHQKGIDIDYRNLLNCQLTHQDRSTYNLTLSFLHSPHQQDQNLKLKTLTLTGTIEDTNDISQKVAQNWVENLLVRSYEFKGVPRSRRVLIIINPNSGSKKGVKAWSSVVEPILKASTAKYQVIFTTYSGHAGELAEKLDLDSVDVVSCVSGDGLVHEVLNGLGRRKSDFGAAMHKLALTSIPCGSGNALSTNHLGPQHARNVYLATLNVLKGTPVRLDLCSTTQMPDKPQEGQKNSEAIRYLSLLSTSFGMMAELDVGTERLRRLGSIRFVLGYLWGAVRNQQRKIRLDVQLVDKDKQEIKRKFEAYRQTLTQQSVDPNYVPTHPNHDLSDSSGLPPLKYGDIRTKIGSMEESSSANPWTTIKTDILSFHAGILPFMSQELLLFPAKIPGHDGTIDIILQRSDSVWKSLACMIGAETGGLFKNPNCEFMKVKAFRLTIDPEENPRSYVVVDGENMPYRSIQVEIHEKAFQSLSLNSDRCPYFGSIGVPGQIL